MYRPWNTKKTLPNKGIRYIIYFNFNAHRVSLFEIMFDFMNKKPLKSLDRWIIVKHMATKIVRNSVNLPNFRTNLYQVKYP